MSEEQVSVAARRRTAAEADQLVTEFEASGLCRKDFCQSRGLKVATLDTYRRRRRAQREIGDSQRWVAVEMGEVTPHAAAGSELTVVLAQGRRIEVPPGFDGGTLERLVTLLERD